MRLGDRRAGVVVGSAVDEHQEVRQVRAELLDAWTAFCGQRGEGRADLGFGSGHCEIDDRVVDGDERSHAVFVEHHGAARFAGVATGVFGAGVFSAGVFGAGVFSTRVDATRVARTGVRATGVRATRIGRGIVVPTAEEHDHRCKKYRESVVLHVDFFKVFREEPVRESGGK